MTAPRLSRRLTLEERIETPDGHGGVTAVWTPLGVHHAAVEGVAGVEATLGAQETERLTHRAFIRYAPPGAAARPRADQRFTSEGRVFQIRSVVEPDDARRWLICHLVEGGAS